MLQTIRNLNSTDSQVQLSKARTLDRKATSGFHAYIQQLQLSEESYNLSQDRVQDEINILREQREQLDNLLSDKASLFHEIAANIATTRSRISKAREFLQLED